MSASPLGRYAPEPADGEQPVDVHLMGVPVHLLVAAREHHDGLLRELRLLAVGGTPAPPEVARLAAELGGRYGEVKPRPDAVVDQALADGVRVLDLHYRVPPSAVPGGEELERLMARADRLGAQGLLMTMERGPLLKRFAAWYLEQLAGQVRGGPPTPWDGPDDLPAGEG